MKHFLLLFAGILISGFVLAQGTITGRILDNDSGEPLPGVNALIEGTIVGSISDLDGDFTINNVPTGRQTLVLSYVGYETFSQQLDVTGQRIDIGTIRLTLSVIGLKEVEIIASMAIDRKTPVAVSTIKGQAIAERVGNQEFPEIMRSTPSVYVTKQGGGFGDSRINIRGFDQRNTAVMINGIPVNDMENGWVYWSNWAGLSDVTSSIQVQRGLGATKLAVPTVGGSINIITNAAEMEKGGVASASFGNDGYQKYGLMLSSGLGNSGWAFTVQGTHTRGNMYSDGTLFQGGSYFASIAKQFNSAHSLQLTAVGAPQWHFQREYGSYDGVTIQTVEERGIRYNPQWGYYENSEFKDNEYSWRKNFYHKPMIFLNYYWTLSEKSELSTSVYASFGRGGGTGDLGTINGSYRTSSRFKDENGIVRWNDIHSWNIGGTVPDFGDDQVPWSGPGVTTVDPGYTGPFAGQSVAESYRNGMILRSSMNEHNWYGLLTNLTTELSDRLSLVTGIDARYYRGLHYRRVEDLLGLDAYYDDNDINEPDKYVTIEGRDKNNQIDYNDDGLVNWFGLFGQLEYSINDLSVFASLSGSNQGFKRIDYFLYEDSDPIQKSDWQNFLGGTVKAGANYNINDNHNVFVNGGYFSRQPIFDNVFPNFTNEVNEDVKNQSIAAFELGYGFRSSIFSANINLYHTKWSNRQISRGDRQLIDDPNNPGETLEVDGNSNYENISQLHQGIEIDFIVTPVQKLRINGMVSLGNWRYTDNFSATWVPEDPAYRDQSKELTLYMTDVKVPDAAQTTFYLGVEYEVFRRLRLYASYFYASDVYADFDLATDESFLTPGNQAWKLPAYGLVDAGVYYGFKWGGTDITLNLNINNLLGNEYIAESETNILYDDNNELDREWGKYGDNGSVRNIAYWGFGRTWNAGVKVRF
jgi:iron complex outermembrane receptor protein